MFSLTLAIYLILVVVSTGAMLLKRDSLSFHTRDYPYFIEQAARLADGRLSNRFALNIDGYNFLGARGTEGVKTIYHAIHAEYFRYFYTLLYLLTGSTLVIYLFYSLIFYLPLLYFAALAGRGPAGAWKAALGFSALVMLNPATLTSVTFDLRPRTLFFAAWALLTLAIVFRRPFIEKLLFFVLLVAIREEGILFGAGALVFNFVYMSFTPEDRRGRWKQAGAFLAISAAALAAFLAFMDWGGFTTVDISFNPLVFVERLWTSGTLLWMIVAGVLALAGALAWAWKRPARLRALALVLAYSPALALVSAQSLRETQTWLSVAASQSAWDVAAHLLSEPQIALTGFFLITGLCVGWLGCDARARRGLGWGLAALGLVFAVTSALVLPSQVQSWLAARAPAQVVWEFKAGIDRYSTRILADYDTYQAFYDCENVYVYNRLPLWMVDPKDRFYPDNKVFLSTLIRDKQVEYIVVSAGSRAAVEELVQMAGLPARQVAANERYLVLKLR